jgi:hypothetical protein
VNVAVADLQPGPITYMPAPEMTPMQMLQIAVSQGADLERIQKLMDLQDRWEAKQALHAFNAALAAFKKNPPVIVKDLMNKQYTNAWYTSLGNLVNTTNAALGEHGLSASWQIEQGETVIAVTCILEHVLGHRRQVRLEGPPDTSGSKNTLQQIRSTLTYLKGSTFEAVTGIASRVGNQDDDGNGAGKRPPQEDAPTGYNNWRADMTALADDGLEALTVSWGKSSGEFRRYVVKYDEAWWRDCKSKAGKVKS